MTKYKDRASTPAYVQLIGNGTSEPFIGCHAIPNRLPPILRYPGETAEAFCNRVLQHLDGEGPCWGRLMYRSESGPLQ